MNEILILLEKNRYFVLLALLGIFFIGMGIFLTREEFFSKPKIEILGVEDPSTPFGRSGQLFVEIVGAVEKPGVYEFPGDSRVDNLLVQAGGLSSSADREWVEKNINRAALLKDGQKIYIPRNGESNESRESKGSTGFVAGDYVSGLININSASLNQLDSLEGIGAVRAQKIIDNRPYTGIDELVSRKILPKSVFEVNKEKLTTNE